MTTNTGPTWSCGASRHSCYQQEVEENEGLHDIAGLFLVRLYEAVEQEEKEGKKKHQQL